MEARKKRIGILTLVFFAIVIFFPFQGGNYSYAMKASDFADIKTTYWGYSYIDFSAEKGIINGYRSNDGNYRFFPENQVSKEESITMLYRTLSAVNQLKSTDDFTSEYADFFSENEIAGWAQRYVAYGLKYDILTQNEVIDFTDDKGIGIPAPREQVALWTAKAMARRHSPAYSLVYTDKDSISKDLLPYIDLLYRQGIMQGDNTKMFHPANGIKRAEFAAICKRVFESANNTVFSEEKEVQSYRGTIVSVDTFNNKIMMTQSDGTNRVIQTNPKTQIVINGKVNYNGLGGIGTGSAGVIAWGAFYDPEQQNTDEHILQLHITTKMQTRTGLLTGMESLDSTTSRLEIENVDGDIIYYVLGKNSQIDGSLKKDTEVTFIADGIKILEIK